MQDICPGNCLEEEFQLLERNGSPVRPWQLKTRKDTVICRSVEQTILARRHRNSITTAFDPAP
jgi:hypothetical protein